MNPPVPQHQCGTCGEFLPHACAPVVLISRRQFGRKQVTVIDASLTASRNWRRDDPAGRSRAGRAGRNGPAPRQLPWPGRPATRRTAGRAGDGGKPMNMPEFRRTPVWRSATR